MNKTKQQTKKQKKKLSVLGLTLTPQRKTSNDHQRTFRVSGKQNSLFPLGPVINGA